MRVAAAEGRESASADWIQAAENYVRLAELRYRRAIEEANRQDGRSAATDPPHAGAGNGDGRP
jgi:hypothetical protein